MFKILLFLLSFLSTYVVADEIKKIEILGNERISDNTILMFSEVSVGDDIGNIETNNILKKLYDTNFFKNVEVIFDKNDLKINVLEFPIVQNVTIEGIKSNKIKDKIFDNIIFKERSSFNEIYLNEDKYNLTTILKDFGYYFSNIQISIEDLSDNKVNVAYQIDLGEKSIIRKITFLGNKKFKDKKLKSVILSEEYKFWKIISGKKYLNESLIAYDKSLLKNFYLNKVSIMLKLIPPFQNY